MNLRRKIVAVAAATVTVLAPGAALADVSITPVQPPRLVAAPGAVSVEGEVRLVTNLETPHYEVGGWALMLEDKALLAQLEGRPVRVSGTPFTGFSILMRKQLVVTAIEVTLEGPLTAVTDLEPQHYELEGFVVQAAAADLAAMAGATVKLTGAVNLGPSIYMKPVVRADSLAVTAPAAEVATLEVRGVLRHNAGLEGPHYEVDGWVVSLDAAEALKLLSGKFVTIKGTEFTGMSIFMRPQLVASELSVTLAGTPVLVNNTHYELHGFVLTGAVDSLQQLASQPVLVTATLLTGGPESGRPALAVSSVRAAADLVPETLLVGGSKVSLPAAVTRRNGHLMLPLRATVEAAGGLVQWDPVAWAVRVSVAGRSTTIAIGKAESGLGTLPVAPYLESGHTMAPAALFEGLGLEVHWDGPSLQVTLPAAGAAVDR